MGYTIAIAGKGGTGKTTIAAILVRLIKEKNPGSILAVDADPNSNLGEALGVSTKATIGSILDDISSHPEKVPQGMPKDAFIEYQVETAIEESDGFDLLSMGHPEGPGCYCYVNNCLRNIVGKIINNYRYIVIDNEAGLEHLSRRTTRVADVLLVISDHTAAGLRAADRIMHIVKELKIKTQKNCLLINRFDGNIDKDKIKDLSLDYLGNIPQDDNIISLSSDGISLLKLKEDSVSIKALRKIKDKIL